MNARRSRTNQVLGRFAGVLRTRRRGSFLVLVVGTLAMLSIIMIVYVAVGNSDKRASTSLERRNRSDEIIGLFSDYVAQVIADDSVAIASEPNNGNANLTPDCSCFYVREAWDAPVTNWFVSSSVNDPNDARFFRAVGAGDDPWLASTTPTWINYDPAGTQATNGMTFTGADGNNKTFTKRRDWLHITNIAPDGRFVNLFNLRNNYNAKPGTSETSGDLGINGQLSLTNQAGLKDAPSAWNAVIGAPSNASSDYQNPAMFDSWQVGAFRPARGPFKNAGADILPDKAEYPPYQWADADGDGFFDSRWFEMVDSRDILSAPTQQSPSTPQFFRNLLPTDPNYRWVFAARIVDLSALVNVNTAGDGQADPNAGWSGNPAATTVAKTNVVGLSPADIDLRRLLTMRDATETVLSGSPPGTFQIGGVSYNGGYGGIAVPPNGNPVSQDYTLYDNKVVGGRPYGISQDLGWGGYESLRATLNLGRPPGRFSNFTINPLKDAHSSFQTIAARREFYSRSAPAIARPAYRSADASKGDLDRLYPSAGGLGGLVSGAIDYGLAFRLNNLIELLTYRSVNDSQVNSTLEAALGGQLQSAFATPPTGSDTSKLGQSFGPLRENRTLELERENLADLTTGQPTEAAMLKSYLDLRQYLTTLSGARPIIPARASASNIDHPPELGESDLATYVPLNPTAHDLFESYATALMPGLVYYNPESSKGTVVEIWKDPATDSDSKKLRGTFYGGQGPLTALLAAGHMAANFASGAQPISGANVSHLPYVLVLGEWAHDNVDNRLPLDTANPGTMSWKRHFPAWWSSTSHQLNLARPPVELPATERSGRAKLPISSGTQPLPAPAVNIYGMGDAHPFLVEAATYTVYRDTPPAVPDALGKDLHYTPPETGFAPYPDLADSSYTYITVNGNVDDSENPDFVCRMFAVKVHNPYGQPIRLTDQSFTASGLDAKRDDQFQANRSGDYFYIKYGTGSDSRCFVLAEVDEKISGGVFDETYSVAPVTIMPGETIVFYALSENSATVAWQRIGYWNRDLRSRGNDKLAANLTAWLDTQLPPVGSPTAKGIRRVQMLRTDDGFDDSRPGASSQISMASFERDRLTPKKDSDQSIMLMRAQQLDSGTGLNDTGGTGNSIKNDRLCDRLRLKTDFDLDRQLKGKKPRILSDTIEMRVDGRRAVTDTRREDSSTVGSSPPHFNTRFMVTIGAAVSRPGDPAADTILPGMIPAWAIDPKDALPAWYRYKEVPTRSGPTISPFQLTENDLNAGTSGATFWGDRPQEWAANQTALFPSMKQDAAHYSPGGTIVDPTGTTFADIRRELGANKNKYQGYKLDGTSLVPDGTSALRSTDFLNVMAIGSVHVPINSSGSEIQDANGNPDWTRQWTTTAEALAMALGYGNPPTSATQWETVGQVFGPLDYYYRDFFGPSLGQPPKTIFDSGYLKLDDFVAVRYDTNDKPYTAGTGAPIAGNVLTMFRTQPDAFASLHIATPGLVNINTAPQAVLRVLPFTFPSQNELVDTTAGQQPSTFWPGSDESTRSMAAPQTDIAAMIESYRDKIAVELRPEAKGSVAGGSSSMPGWFTGFFDRTKASFNVAGDQDANPSDPALGDYSTLPATYKGGRFWSTGLTGIREDAGFRSVGELLAVRQVEFDSTTMQVTTAANDLEKRTSNIDFLGHRPVGSPTNLLGTDNILEQVVDVSDPANPKVTDVKPLQFGHTYQDKLKILSGLLGSISVRSDMYAVWFIARGYQRSDVEGLPALQPMVPSVERRFLMIIDRSNVTKVGQKPRVLAYVELPL